MLSFDKMLLLRKKKKEQKNQRMNERLKNILIESKLAPQTSNIVTTSYSSNKSAHFE